MSYFIALIACQFAMICSRFPEVVFIIFLRRGISIFLFLSSSYALSLPIASSKDISPKSEYCSIDATICKYLSGTAFNSLQTKVESSNMCPKPAALFARVVSFAVKVSIVSSSFICNNSNSDLSVCNLACWTLSSPTDVQMLQGLFAFELPIVSNSRVLIMDIEIEGSVKPPPNIGFSLDGRIIVRFYLGFYGLDLQKANYQLVRFKACPQPTAMCGSTERGSGHIKGRPCCSHLASQAVQQSVRRHDGIDPPVANAGKKHVLDETEGRNETNKKHEEWGADERYNENGTVQHEAWRGGMTKPHALAAKAKPLRF
nr:hypothetical protein [Tanacetum cinerariifolium]